MTALGALETTTTTRTGPAADLELAVPGLEHLDALLRGLRTKPHRHRARIQLHLDVGLARDGASPADWALPCEASRTW